MRMSAGKILGGLVLLRVAVDAVSAVERVSRSLGFRPSVVTVRYGLLISLTLVALRVIVRFGVWRLFVKRRWAWLLLAAFLCSLPGGVVSFAAIFPGILHEGPALAFTIRWTTLVGEFLFPAALLATEVVPAWVAAVGMAVVVADAANSPLVAITRGVHAWPFLSVAWLASDLAVGAEILFMVALAVILIRGTGTVAPASNKRIERTPLALD